MYHKNIRLLKIFNFLIGFSLFAPLAIIYFSKVSGSYALGASIFGITMLSSAIFEVPTGVWSDRAGRRGTIILGSWARVIAFVLYAIGLSYWWLVAGAILEGLSRAFYSGNNDAFLYYTLADERLEQQYDDYLGKTSSTEQMALGLSALFGGMIATWSFSYLLWLSVMSQMAMLYVSYLFIEPRSRNKLNTNLFAHLSEAVKFFVANKKLRLLSFASIINYSFSEMMYQFRAAFISLVWPLWAVGLANVLSNIGATLSFYYSGKIIKRFKAVNILLFRGFWTKLASFIAYGIPSIFSPLILATSSLLFGVGSVVESKLMQAEFSDHQRSTMASLNSFAGNIAFAIMSIVLGSLADSTSPAKALFILNIVSLPIIYIYYLMFKNERKTNI